MRTLALIFAALAAFTLTACGSSDPLGLYPEPERKVEAPLILTGRVVDAADLLSDAEQERVTTRLAKIEAETLAQLVVVTTPSLNGHSIEDYSLMLGRGWGIGDNERNDGLLLVVAPNDRQVRIEVGYGLENTLEDPEAAEIIREMMPLLEKRDYADAISLGVDRLEAELHELAIKETA